MAASGVASPGPCFSHQGSGAARDGRTGTRGLRNWTECSHLEYNTWRRDDQVPYAPPRHCGTRGGSYRHSKAPSAKMEIKNLQGKVRTCVGIRTAVLLVRDSSANPSYAIGHPSTPPPCCNGGFGTHRRVLCKFHFRSTAVVCFLSSGSRMSCTTAHRTARNPLALGQDTTTTTT